MQLELRNLCAYLPYDLQMVNKIGGIETLFYQNINHALKFWKPILRPLSDLFNDRLNPVPINETKSLYGWDYLWYDVYKKGEKFNVNALKWAVLSKLFEWHFDVFGLIDAGLAISIHDVEGGE